MKRCSAIILLFSVMLFMTGCSSSNETFELLPMDESTNTYYVRMLDENSGEKVVSFKVDNGEYLEMKAEDVLIVTSDHSRIAHATRTADGTWTLYVPSSSQ